jgi:hypothetical protein
MSPPQHVPVFFNSDVTSYDLAVKGNRDQFLSEKLLTSYYNKTVSPHYELRDDLFSLGMIVLATATQKTPGHFYNWSQKGQPTLNCKRIDHCLKEVQRRYSTRLVKKIQSLVYPSQFDTPSDLSALSDNLAELDEEISRVMARARRISEGKRD